MGVAGVFPYYLNRAAYDNQLIGAPPNWKLDYILNYCDSDLPVPAGIIRHDYAPVDPHTLYYPHSSWCLRQLAMSSAPRIAKSQTDDRLAALPIHDIQGYLGIIDMAGDLDARYYTETQQWSELVLLLNKLNSLSDTATGHRLTKGYAPNLPPEHKAKLKPSLESML